MQQPHTFQQMQPKPEFRQCFNCNYEEVTIRAACPRCRHRKFLTSSGIRNRGIALLLIGLFLVILMGGIAVFVAILLVGAANNPDSAKRINNSISMLIGMYALFAAVIAFGLNSMLGGIWMIVAGKRNRVLVWIMWAILAVILLGGGIIRMLLP